MKIRESSEQSIPGNPFVCDESFEAYEPLSLDELKESFEKQLAWLREILDDRPTVKDFGWLGVIGLSVAAFVPVIAPATGIASSPAGTFIANVGANIFASSAYEAFREMMRGNNIFSRFSIKGNSLSKTDYNDLIEKIELYVAVYKEVGEKLKLGVREILMQNPGLLSLVSENLSKEQREELFNFIDISIEKVIDSHLQSVLEKANLAPSDVSEVEDECTPLKRPDYLADPCIEPVLEEVNLAPSDVSEVEDECTPLKRSNYMVGESYEVDISEYPDLTPYSSDQRSINNTQSVSGW